MYLGKRQAKMRHKAKERKDITKLHICNLMTSLKCQNSFVIGFQKLGRTLNLSFCVLLKITTMEKYNLWKLLEIVVEKYGSFKGEAKVRLNQ